MSLNYDLMILKLNSLRFNNECYRESTDAAMGTPLGLNYAV